ncbi:HTH domain-containing protein [Spirosomataceae bacterium TFI 002]|nr:HTH domain-containing protein [Spirosomataceae bacterium TFI 002]
MEKPRISRLTSILTQLQGKRLTTATELAQKYDVSVRTIYRDIRTLENSGVPIFTEEGKGYSLVEGYRLPPVTFSENEANALITAAQIIAQNKDTSLVENYQNAIAKLKAVLNSDTKAKVQILSERIQIRSNIGKEQTSSFLMEIQNAISNNNHLHLDYHSLEDKLSSRKVEPFAIYSTQDNWLLIAHCCERNNFRAFRLDRIKALKTLATHFKPFEITLEEYFRICREKYINTPDIPMS